ncbi:MAG: TRAP transporter fused permease subunit, partial [Rhodospirillaceae bacterium]|nr:TRAP transporter fused permease subunit [Rhodospirillaceae bacterium]
MEKFNVLLLRVCLGSVPIVGICWIFSVSDRFGVALTFQQMVGTVLGLSMAAAFIKHPYGERPGLLEIALALISFFSWFWMSWNFEEWIVGMADRTPDKWIPAIIAVLCMMEALRKACGLVITILVWVMIAYAYFGDLLPGVMEADVFPPTKTILYLYADNNGIPGLVLRVVAELVLAFIILGKLLEVSGATKFFTDLAMALMGHRRGGPAKVAVVASSAFGTISGSAVGNIMSTGIVTIPMMKRTGFEPRYAAGIEAVASNGGQIAPPVMGATAFIIAEFLEVPYIDVVIAASIPAALYYLVLFLQVDAIAARYGLEGLPKAELPRAWPVIASGWVFILPLGVLIYYLFGLGYNPALSAMNACVALLVLWIVRNRRLPNRAECADFIFGSGDNLVPLILIAGGAGVVMGVLNSTGLAFQLSIILTDIGQSAGIFVMLLMTAFVSIILGMGMPTAAIYIILATVVAPALIEMGLQPMAAHLFLFYFGLLSLLTPPVAVASMVAAGLAGADMWKTGLVGLQLAAAAYLMPFLWVFNPALIFNGSWQAILYVTLTALAAGFLVAEATVSWGRGGAVNHLRGVLYFAATIAVGSATLWLGAEQPLTLAVAAA